MPGPHPYREPTLERERPTPTAESALERALDTIALALAILCGTRMIAALAVGVWDGEATAATLGLLLLLWTGSLRMCWRRRRS